MLVLVISGYKSSAGKMHLMVLFGDSRLFSLVCTDGVNGRIQPEDTHSPLRTNFMSPDGPKTTTNGKMH